MTLLERYILGKKKQKLLNSLKKEEDNKKSNVTLHIPELSKLVQHLDVVYADIIKNQRNNNSEPPIQEVYDVLGNPTIPMSFYNTGDSRVSQSNA